MKILNFGSMNIDKVYRVGRLVGPGETISSRSFRCFPGGKGLNQSIAVARAKGSIFHAGTIGEDGLFLKDLMKESGVDVRFVRRMDTVSGHAVIQVDEKGENGILLFPGSNYKNDKEYVDTVLSHFEENDILMLQNEINDPAYLIKRGREKGMRILLNPSPVDERIGGKELSCVTWLIVNRGEGEMLAGAKEPEEILSVFRQRYPKLKTVLTLGKEGALYSSQDALIRQLCFPARTVDTTAAGDTFTGFFIAAVAEGAPVEKALELAACASSITVSRNGAAVSIPDRAEVEKMLENSRGRETQA